MIGQTFKLLASIMTFFKPFYLGSSPELPSRPDALNADDANKLHHIFIFGNASTYMRAGPFGEPFMNLHLKSAEHQRVGSLFGFK